MLQKAYVWEMEQHQCNLCLYTNSIHCEEHTLLARLFLSVKSGRSGTHLAAEHRVNFSPPADRRPSGSQANWLTGSYICRLCCCGHTGWMWNPSWAWLETCFELNFCHGCFWGCLCISIAKLLSKVFQGGALSDMIEASMLNKLYIVFFFLVF